MCQVSLSIVSAQSVQWTSCLQFPWEFSHKNQYFNSQILSPCRFSWLLSAEGKRSTPGCSWIHWRIEVNSCSQQWPPLSICHPVAEYKRGPRAKCQADKCFWLLDTLGVFYKKPIAWFSIMSTSHLSNRAESHFQAQEEHELETLGKKAWDNPAYNGSPSSSSLKIRAIYNPKSILENPYENIEKLTGSLSYPKDRKATEEAKKKETPFPGCCYYVFKGIRGNWGGGWVGLSTEKVAFCVSSTKRQGKGYTFCAGTAEGILCRKLWLCYPSMCYLQI